MFATEMVFVRLRISCCVCVGSVRLIVETVIFFPLPKQRNWPNSLRNAFLYSPLKKQIYFFKLECNTYVILVINSIVANSVN
jgi:hypothetical protein